MILNNLRNDTPKWQVLVFGKLKHLNCVSLWASRAARVNKIQRLLLLQNTTTGWGKIESRGLFRRKYFIYSFYLILLFAGFLLPNLLSSWLLACFPFRCRLLSFCSFYLLAFSLLILFFPFILFSFFLSIF